MENFLKQNQSNDTDLNVKAVSNQSKETDVTYNQSKETDVTYNQSKETDVTYNRSKETDVKSAYNQRSSRNKNRNFNHKRNQNHENKFNETSNVRQVINYLKRYIFETFMPLNSEVLDFACGQGGDLNKFAHQKISHYIGIDLSGKAIEEASYRAKTNPRFMKHVKEYSFQEIDLCKNIVRIEPQVNIVSCQLALHYMWADINTFMTSVRDSLKRGGFFLITIMDSTKIPVTGIQNHKFIKISPLEKVVTREKVVTTKTTESQTKQNLNQTDLNHANGANQPVEMKYRFSFPGLVNNVEEYLITKERLIDKCMEFSLQMVDNVSAKEIWSKIKGYSQNPLHLTDIDWQAIDLYRAYVFRKI